MDDEDRYLPAALDDEEPPEELDVDCPSCGTTIEALDTDSALHCPECQATVYFASCAKCMNVASVAVAPGLTARRHCPQCFETLTITRRVHDDKLVVKGIVELVTCGDMLYQAEQPESIPGQRIWQFTVVGGYGWSIRPGKSVTVQVGYDLMMLWEIPVTDSVTVPYDELVSLDFYGGRETRGGGFFGGGFGLLGALQGMVVASLLNSLTTKTSVNSVVRISGVKGETLLHIAGVMPQELRTMFAPAVNAVAARKSGVAVTSGTPALSGDVLERLERLAALREQGHLTDDEFTAAKQQLLGLA